MATTSLQCYLEHTRTWPPLILEIPDSKHKRSLLLRKHVCLPYSVSDSKFITLALLVVIVGVVVVVFSE